MNQKEQTIYTWLQERIGEGYVWGASGYILTESKLNELIKQIVVYERELKEDGRTQRIDAAASYQAVC